MSRVTPKTSQIDRRLRAVREAMGDQYLLANKVQRKTRALTTADLHRRAAEIRASKVMA